LPFPLDCRHRKSESCGGLIQRQTAEELELHNLTLAFVEGFKVSQCGVDVQNIDRVLCRRRQRRVQRDTGPHPRPLRRFLGPGPIDQYAPHHLRGETEELRPILPDRPLLVDQSEIRLMHQLGWLERCLRGFAPQTVGGAKPKLTINQWHELIPRRQIAVAPGAEQRRHIVARRRWH
jgi:hypothetical protein